MLYIMLLLSLCYFNTFYFRGGSCSAKVFLKHLGGGETGKVREKNNNLNVATQMRLNSKEEEVLSMQKTTL